MTAVTGAWATEVTIATNQQQTSYTSGDITISVQDFVDGDGAHVSSWCPMIITCGDGNVLQSVVVTIGYYPENALDVPHIALPARGKAPDVPHIALPACGKAPDVPHIVLPAHGKAPDVPHIALHAHGNAPRCTPQRTIF